VGVMEATASLLTVSGVLIGFLFAGFWWALNRELTFPPRERHFKPSYALLILTMVLLGYFGVAIPLRRLAANDPAMVWTYRGIVLALLGILGYMLTELGHYSIYQRPKYVTTSEWFWFGLTTAGMSGLLVWWVIH
jgi:hypothetical protein